MDNSPTKAEMKAAFERIEKVGWTLIEEIESLDQYAKATLDLVASGSNYSTIVDVLLSDNFEDIDAGDQLNNEALQTVYNFMKVVPKAKIKVGKLKRGRPRTISETAFHWMLDGLYKKYTGKRGTVSTDGEGKRCGPFVEFVKECSRPLMRIQSTDSIGERIRINLRLNPSRYPKK